MDEMDGIEDKWWNTLESYGKRFRWWREKYDLTWNGIKQGTKNLVFWFPVIWKDRWWDHSFLYSILGRKLAQMEKGFRENGISVNSKQDAKNIKICILLLDRLQNNDYVDYKNEKGWVPEEKWSYDKEEKMINQDLDMLFSLMRKHIQTWWD